MHSNRAQISIFLILGVLIIFFVLLFMFMSSSRDNLEDTIQIPFERASINNFITNCLKDMLEEGMFLIGKQGGYIEPKAFISSDNYNIAYLYDKGTSRVPGNQDVESDLEKYIDQNMVQCLRNFKSFEDQGWKVTYEQPESFVQLNQRDVTVQQKFLISIEKDSSITFQEFTHTTPVRLGYLLSITNQIVEFHRVEPEWTDLTALSEHDVDITIFPYKQKLMYSLKDSQSSIKGNPYMFNFALDFP